MTSFVLTHPVATISREIENLILKGENSDSLAVQGGCALLSRTISITALPAFLALELVFKRIPKMCLAIGNPEKFSRKADKVAKYAIGLLATPLGLRCADSVSGFFLKKPLESEVRPFGVEQEYGRAAASMCFPRSVEELQEIVKTAKHEGKQISVVGAGFSQGTQTVPKQARHLVINTKYLKSVELAPDGKTVTAQAGATWEQVQLHLDARGKSSIVKQASDPFSIGGSIGINCHGWAHEDGALSSTVVSLDIIDSDGNLRTLTKEDELFGCMFGTLGYFGIVVSAKMRVLDNEPLIEKCELIDIDKFGEQYRSKIKGHDYPLFGGRLTLDQLKGNPLRQVAMVRYERDFQAQQEGTRPIAAESPLGRRIERVVLSAISRLTSFTTKRVLHLFWKNEYAHMLKERKVTRNEALHPPINAFKMLHKSNLHAEWLQEYFVKEENLADFLRFLGKELKDNDVRLTNATIRPVPKDTVSILPYAEQDRHAVVICFAQRKTKREIEKTRHWVEKVNRHLVQSGDVFYQAYMPYATRAQFETCYGEQRVENMRQLKEKYDPGHLFGNAHTAKYYDARRS